MARWKILLLGAAVLLLVAVLVGAELLLTYALDREADFSMYSSFAGGGGALSDDEKWMISASENWYLPHASAGMETLHAYFLPGEAENHRYALLCHGYASDGFSVMGFLRHYHNLGWGVLVPEAFAHGQSEGRYVGMGWLERQDVVNWIHRLIEHDPQAQIVLHGISMGGATVMMVSGEALPANVRAIVEDCGYSSVWEEFAWQLDQVFHLPAFPMLYLTSGLCRLQAGYFFGEASAVKQLRKSVTPTLFIHGSADTFVPFAMLDQVYGAAACEKELLVIEGASHGASSWKDPDLYWATVDDFIARHLSAAP